MAAINERFGIIGEVCAVLEVEDRAFGGGSKIHGSKCPWWKKRTSKSCTCGRILIRTYENSVSDRGDRHYAEGYCQAITGDPTPLFDIFDTMTVATAVTTAFGSKTADSGDVTTIPTGGTKTITNYGTGTGTRYPTVSDPDTNNPGATVGVDTVTWKATYTTSEGNGTLVGVCIHEAGALFGGTNNAPLLMSVDLSPTIVKSSGISLALYVNHNFLGS